MPNSCSIILNTANAVHGTNASLWLSANLNLLTLVNMYRYLITKHPAPKIKKAEKKPAEFSVGETKVIDFSDVKDSDMPKLPDWFFEK